MGGWSLRRTELAWTGGRPGASFRLAETHLSSALAQGCRQRRGPSPPARPLHR